MSKYCEQCGTKLEDDAMFCSECGNPCSDKNVEVNKNERFLSNRKKRIIFWGTGGLLVILLTVGAFSGFFHNSKKGYVETEKKANKKSEEQEIQDEEEPKRIGREYEYNLIGEEIKQCDQWFEISDELFGFAGEKIYRLNQMDGTLKQIGNTRSDKLIPHSGENEWFVYMDSDHLYKYNIQKDNSEAIMETDWIGSTVVVDNVLYYCSEKERMEWGQKAQESDSYVPPFSGSEHSIWAFDLETGNDKKIVENVRGYTALDIDPLDNRYFYFAMPSAEGENFARYDCVEQKAEIIEKNDRTAILVPYKGDYYKINNDIIFVKDGKEICMKKGMGSDASYKVAARMNDYIVCKLNPEELVIVKDEEIHEIKVTWAEDWLNETGDIISVQEGKIWFLRKNVSKRLKIVYAVDFNGNLLEETMYFKDGSYVAFWDNALWMVGQPQEKWEINKKVTTSMADEMVNQGYNIDSFEVFEEGRTELLINVGEYGFYQIPLPDKVDSDEEDQQEQELENQEKAASTSSDVLDIDQKVADLVMYFQGYSGVWGEFGVHADEYQGMIEQAIKSSISLSDYFGGDVNEVYLDVSNFQWDGINAEGASCFVTFEGESPGNGKFRTLTGSVSVNESGDLEFIEADYY